MALASYLAEWRAEVPALIGSVVAVSVMVGFAALLGFRKRATIDSEATLGRYLEGFEPDARIEHALVDTKGRSALARLADGRVLAAVVMGNDVAMRFATSGQTWLKIARGKLMVALGEVGFPQLHLHLQDNQEPPAWITQMAKGGLGGGS